MATKVDMAEMIVETVHDVADACVNVDNTVSVLFDDGTAFMITIEKVGPDE